MDFDTLWQILLGMVWFIFIGKVFISLYDKYENLKQKYPLAKNPLLSALAKLTLFTALFFGPLLFYALVFLEKP